MDRKTIKSIEDWPTPTSVTNIRSFNGLSDYYQNFIEKFSRIACHMTAFQNKANKFLWMTKCEEIFQKLKQILTTAPILKIMDLDGDFVVCTDSSKEGLRGVLLQNDCTVCYELQELKEHKNNYPTHDLELESIIHALKMWRHYLTGNKLLLKIDNMGMH